MNSKRKILLLNPPGDQLYLRILCSSFQQSRAITGIPTICSSKAVFLRRNMKCRRSMLMSSADHAQALAVSKTWILTLCFSWPVEFPGAMILILLHPSQRKTANQRSFSTVISSLVAQPKCWRNIPLSRRRSWISPGCIVAVYPRRLRGEKTDYITYRYQRPGSGKASVHGRKGIEVPFQRLELFPWKESVIPHGRYMPFASTTDYFGALSNAVMRSSIVPLKLRKPEMQWPK